MAGPKSSPCVTLRPLFPPRSLNREVLRWADHSYKNEAVLYGRFIKAEYAMFERASADPCPLPATGEIAEPFELVAWINMSDFVFWWPERPKFCGFITRDQEQKHNFVLALRGTEGWVEWLDDAMARLERFRQVPNVGRVEHGFDKIYSTLKVLKRHVAPGLRAAVLV